MNSTLLVYVGPVLVIIVTSLQSTRLDECFGNFEYKKVIQIRGQKEATTFDPPSFLNSRSVSVCADAQIRSWTRSARVKYEYAQVRLRIGEKRSLLSHPSIYFL